MRPTMIFAGIATLLCAIAVTAQPTDDSATQLQTARQYIQAKRFYEAQKLADTVLASNPNDADAQRVRDEAASGLRAVNDAQVAQAEANARRAGATDQDRLALANAYYDAGSYRAAADLYAKMPASMIDRDTRLRWARSLAWSSQLDPAERVYAQIRKDNDSPDVELEYGQLLSWMGASRASVDTLQTVYSQKPTEDSAIALANAMAWNGNREGAIKLLNDYTASNADAVRAKQLAQQMSASPELRIERVNRMIDAEPYNLALQMEKARLLEDAGRYSEALSTIAFVRDHSTHKIEGLDELEKAAKEGRDKQLAQLQDQLKTLDADGMASSSSQNADQILSLAKAYTGAGDYRTAERLYTRYLRMRPNDTDARVQYARVLSWDRRYAESEAQYERLLANDPNRADLRLEYAQIQSWNSEFAPAIHTFRSLTDLSDNPRANLYPDVAPRAYYNIGQIYRWYGWNDTAASAENRALALDGSYAPARNELDLIRHLRPTSTADARVTYATDSSDFTTKRADLTAEKWTSQRTAFDLSLGRHEFEQGDQDQDVYANVISGGGRYRWNDQWTARAQVGMNFYDSGLGTRPFFGVGAEWLPSLQSRASFDFNHYDLVYDVFTLASLGTPTATPALDLRDPLSINDFRGHYDYNSGGFWSALGDASYGFVSDDNRREAAHGMLTFRVLKAPFVALKAEGHYLSYDFRTNRYWSPTDYKSLAGVVQVGQNVRNRFFWTLEAKAGRAYEQSRSSDLRAYEGTITVPINDALDLVGDYGYGKSGRFQSLSPLGTDSADFTNYWQRHWYAGIRVKQLHGHGDRQGRNSYYYDTRPLAGASPVIPPLGEAH